MPRQQHTTLPLPPQSVPPHVLQVPSARAPAGRPTTRLRGKLARHPRLPTYIPNTVGHFRAGLQVVDNEDALSESPSAIATQVLVPSTDGDVDGEPRKVQTGAAASDAAAEAPATVYGNDTLPPRDTTLSCRATISTGAESSASKSSASKSSVSKETASKGRLRYLRPRAPLRSAPRHRLGDMAVEMAPKRLLNRAGVTPSYMTIVALPSLNCEESIALALGNAFSGSPFRPKLITRRELSGGFSTPDIRTALETVVRGSSEQTLVIEGTPTTIAEFDVMTCLLGYPQAMLFLTVDGRRLQNLHPWNEASLTCSLQPHILEVATARAQLRDEATRFQAYLSSLLQNVHHTVGTAIKVLDAFSITSAPSVLRAEIMKHLVPAGFVRPMALSDAFAYRRLCKSPRYSWGRC